MNLKELSSPIRMYWDIGPGKDRIDYPKIAGEIADAKILALQITETGQKLSASCLIVLETLKHKPTALSLVLSVTALDESALQQLRHFPIRLLLISASDPAALESIVEIKKQVQAKPPVGAAFSVTRTNFRTLPDVLKFCIEQHIESLVLPMQRLTAEEKVFSFSTDEQQELTSKLSRIERPAWLKIIIHDPFLWRAFFPSVEFPDGGCQAANTMLYISLDADVYPCPTLPVKIGNLQRMSLNDVVTSGLKKEIRKDILVMPADCNGCSELKHCKGGCRGRAYRLKKSLNGRDPVCEFQR